MKKLSLLLLILVVLLEPILMAATAPGNKAIAASENYGTVNLAKNKPVTALTGTVRGNPGDVNDGNVDSVWYSMGSNYGGNSNANSFVLDLGNSYSIGRIEVFTAQIHGCTISTSDDNKNWTERYKSPWSNTSISAPISVAPNGTFSARYIKYWGFANWSQYVGVQEINVFEWLTSPPSSPSGVGTTNLALNKTVTNLQGSVVQSDPPAYAVDGKSSTFWSSSMSGQDDGTHKWQNYGQIKIDLGEKYEIGKVVVSPQRVHNYWMVMGETDPYPAGSPWFFMTYPELFGTTNTASESHTFLVNGSVTARYIWVFTGIWGTPSSLAPGIAEIEVYEWSGTSSPPAATATATPAPGVTSTPAPITQPGDTTLLAEERSVAPNGKITVPIRLDKASRLGSLNFSLRYDPSVVKVNKAEVGDLAGGTLFQANTKESGIIRFGIAAQGSTGISGDGPIAHVEFTALGSMGNQSQLSLGDALATDTTGASIGVKLQSGRVTIEAKMKGDYDGDGKITAKDSLAALKMSVKDLVEDLILDMDDNGKVTAEDARRILSDALGGATSVIGQTPAALPPLVSQTLKPSSDPQLVSYNDEVGVIIPGDTIESRQTITISPAPDLPAHPSKGFTQLATYDISMGNVREFKEPLTIEIAYDPSAIPSHITPDQALSVGWWHTDLKAWVNAPFAVDTTRNVIMIPTTHLTVWEVVALAKGWDLKEAEHFKTYYDPNSTFNIAGDKGPAASLAEDVGIFLDKAYKAYEDAQFSMRLTFIPSTAIGTFMGALAGGAAGGLAGFYAGGIVGARAGLNAGGKIGAKIGTAAGAILVGSKTYVILDDATSSAEWNKNYMGEIYIPLRHTNRDELHHDLAHELFHAVQNGYFSVAESGGPIADYLGTNGHWWIEATADYAPVGVGLSTLDALPKITPKYFQQALPIEGNEREYITSRFIAHMQKRRIDFKTMWDATACLACTERLTTTMLARLEMYHEQYQRNLHTLFRDFATEVFFDSNSPLDLETGKTLETSGAVSQNTPLSPTDSTISYTFKLPADYTAQLWRIPIGFSSSQAERSLKMEMTGAMPSRDKVTVGVFVLPNDQRVPGGVRLATKVIRDGEPSATLTAKKGDVIYIMAVNSQTTDQSVTVKVSDANSGKWVQVGRIESVDPSKDGPLSKGAFPTSATISSNSATVISQKSYSQIVDKVPKEALLAASRWEGTWPEPPKEMAVGQKWNGKVTLVDKGSDAFKGGYRLNGSIKIWVKPSGAAQNIVDISNAVPAEPSQVGSRDFSWTIVEPVAPGTLPQQMSIFVETAAFGRNTGGGDDLLYSTRARVEYMYELRP